MNIIPFAKFVGALLFAGAMMYMFFPVMDTIFPLFPGDFTGENSTWLILMALWNGIPIIVLVKETIQLLMSMQRRTLL